ncbi:MAG TPA: nicotinate-nucleotide adenylyltransferase [Vicinamibacteria bacterium]|nr:nicotinate-nucleotide adenylyltransferase [Vicinamibacteria bacterium]
MSERLGVFGGTFDPIHLGHLRAAECARAVLGLDRVLFLPAGQPPHRPGARASSCDRYAMVSLATAGHAAFVPDDRELRRQGPSYTADTLEEIAAAAAGVEIFLILGADAYAEMGTWHAPRRVAALCTIAVVTRPGAAPPAAPPVPGARVVTVPADTPDLSSTAVRHRRAQGADLSGLVPPPVAEYILKRELYR